MSSQASSKKKVYSSLVKILGPENVLHEKVDLICYDKDCICALREQFIPDFVVRPKTTQEVAEVVKLANKYRIPVVPRGGGTASAGGTVPVKGGIVMELRGMDKILEMDTINRTVTVQAGIYLKELDEELSKKGFFLADKPTSWFSNALGSRMQCLGLGFYMTKYGYSFEQALSMEVVTGTGEIIRTGSSKVYEPASGYDLVRLFSNQEGTLGIITEITLRIHRKPEYVHFESIKFPDWYKMTDCLLEILDSGIVPSTILSHDSYRYARYVEKTYEEFYKKKMPPVPENIGVILIELSGKEEIVKTEIEIVNKIANKHKGEVLPSAIADSWVKSREMINFNPWPLEYPRFGEKRSPYVLTVPLTQQAKVYENYLKLVKKHDLKPFGAGGFYRGPDFTPSFVMGVYFNENDENGCRKYKQYQEDMDRVVIAHGGGLGASVGTGMLKLSTAKELYGSSIELMKKIKSALDPNNILNPGKKIEV